MYDKSLEQLIDAVIADGVITDQERKVVYKKAATLGIDQDEIEVYLEGRLDAFNKTNQPQSGKYGTVKTCPNCGAVVDSFSGKCSECGYNFVDISSNKTTKQLQIELEKIDKDNKQSIAGSLFAHIGLDNNTNRKVQIIKNFSIPNTKADLIEFALLCYSNLSTTASTNADFELRKAWSAKAKQVIAKAKLLFPTDADVLNAISHLSKERTSFFKAHQKTITIISIWIVIAIFFGSLCYFVSLSSDKDEKYTIEKVQEIENLPYPDTNNYKDCYRSFSKIHWTESTYMKGYNTFLEAQIAYRDLLINAYMEAGVSEDMIPQSLMLIGRDLNHEKTESEEIVNTSNIQEENAE